jgi:hypothetical protein
MRFSTAAVFALVVTVVTGSPAKAADCSRDEGGASSIYIAGTGDDERLAELARLDPLEIARVDAQATVAIAASELRLHLNNGTDAVGVKPGFGPACGRAIVLAVSPSSAMGEQDFLLRTTSGNLLITARTSIGLLYGAYETLYAMGFRWYGTTELWISRPSRPVLPDFSVPRAATPRFALRGAHTFEASVPDEHLLWMARNKQNLIGSGVNAQLARALGIHLEGGGHNVISTILHSSRLVDGISLLAKHPHWYGSDRPSGGAAKEGPVPYNADSYSNPCFAREDLIRFFGSELANRLLDGDLRDVAVLSLWPSDQPNLNLPSACKAQLPGARPVAHLIRFYSGVMRILQAEISRRRPERRVTIAGISYYDTWEAPDSGLLAALAPLPNVSFLQVLYVNERSYSEPISSSQIGTNRVIGNAIAAWSRALSPNGVQMGICDYYNYSIFYSLPSSFAAILPDDFDTYERQSASFINYMHPVKPDASPQRLLETLRSRLSWKGHETAAEIIGDYMRRMFGPLQLQPVLADVDRALSNLAEILGTNSSLLLMLGQHKFWTVPAFPEAQVPAAIATYLNGGRHRLPLVRQTFFAPLESEFVGILQSIQLLRSAERRAAELMAVSVGDVRRRLEQDVPWIAFSRAIYEAVASVALGALPPQQGGIPKDEALRRLADAFRDVDRFDRFGFTLSKIDQKATFQQRIEYARSRLDAR